MTARGETSADPAALMGLWHDGVAYDREGRRNLRGPCSPDGRPAFLAYEFIAESVLALCRTSPWTPPTQCGRSFPKVLR